MSNYLFLILAMALVTYIPRYLPLAMISKRELPPRLHEFLKYIPCTALGALIIPGVFTATPKMPMASLGGIAFAFIYGWYKGGIIVSVLGSILVAFILLSL